GGRERRESGVVELVLHLAGREADGQRSLRGQSGDGVADLRVSGQHHGGGHRALAERQVADAGRRRGDGFVEGQVVGERGRGKGEGAAGGRRRGSHRQRHGVVAEGGGEGQNARVVDTRDRVGGNRHALHALGVHRTGGVGEGGDPVGRVEGDGAGG